MMKKTSSISKYFTAVFLAAGIAGVSAQDTYLQTIYQDVDYLQRGLFESPPPGVADTSARMLTAPDKITDMLHFSASAGIRYDNNIFLSRNNRQGDFIFSVSPTLSLVSGQDGTALNTFSFSYTPTFSFYGKNTDRNTVDHRASIRYAKIMPRGKMVFDLGYTNSFGSNRFRSGAIDQSALNARVSYNYVLSPKTRFDISAGTAIDDFANADLQDVRDYSLRASFIYQASGKLSIGPSLAYRHSNISTSRNQDAYEIGAKFNYQATGKTAINGTFGYNVVTFKGDGASANEPSFAWTIGVNHRLSSKTNIRASFYSRANIAYNFKESGYFSRGIGVNASHQLSPRAIIYGRVNYENDDYFKTDLSDINLNNDYYSATLGLRYKMNNGVSLGGNMTWRENIGNYQANNFKGFTVGVNASYSFW